MSGRWWEGARTTVGHGVYSQFNGGRDKQDMDSQSRCAQSGM
jgi:hypothetical protein